ncbi:hypothetical protein H632_c963p1 [Helicosporidium sp. ATCC 50920]|nr:hypothetical protein H632_c963p1 [Helicosporidium sp. ATCC 50920]|eukprot:KDD74958.1 hypothetical protein H632_c963p1 [Helicosporidium sp. ATCC 50920]
MHLCAAESEVASVGVEACALETSHARDSVLDVAHHPPPLPIPLVRQNYEWDCGLACASMALQALSLPDSCLRSLYAACSPTSLWSIDLAHLLAARGARVTLSTLTLGANAAYAAQPFYSADLAADARRVARLFRKAASCGVGIRQGARALGDVVELVRSRRAVVVALVDQALLWMLEGKEGEQEDASDVLSEPARFDAAPSAPTPPCASARSALRCSARLQERRCSGSTKEHEYRGHYVVLVDVQGESQTLQIRDPAQEEPCVFVSLQSFERAWRAFGTDEDLLIVQRHEIGEWGA